MTEGHSPWPMAWYRSFFDDTLTNGKGLFIFCQFHDQSGRTSPWPVMYKRPTSSHTFNIHFWSLELLLLTPSWLHSRYRTTKSTSNWLYTMGYRSLRQSSSSTRWPVCNKLRLTRSQGQPVFLSPRLFHAWVPGSYELSPCASDWVSLPPTQRMARSRPGKEARRKGKRQETWGAISIRAAIITAIQGTSTAVPESVRSEHLRQ